MPQIFDNTYTGSKSEATGSKTKFDVTSGITGSVLLTTAFFEFTNVDVKNTAASSVNSSLQPVNVYTYIQRRKAANSYGVNEVDTTQSFEVNKNTSTTIAGPLQTEVALGSKNGGTMIHEAKTLGFKIDNTHNDIDFDGSFDWEVRLLGRRML